MGLLLQEAIRCHRQGEIQEAEELYRKILAQKMSCFDSLYHLGVLRGELGDREEAIAFLSKALFFRPDSVETAKNLAYLLVEEKREEEAVKVLKSCLERRPRDVGFLLEYACFLHRKARFQEAMIVYQDLLMLVPDHPDALCNTALAHIMQGQYEEGLVWLEKALTRHPDHAPSKANRSLLLLLLGRHLEGWPDYAAWRKTKGEYQRYASLMSPAWKGDPLLPGQVLLVLEEQGLGDSLHFFRYLPLIQQKAGKTLFFCNPSLVSLLSSQGQAISCSSSQEEIPPHDFHFFMMDAPLIFGMSMEDIPSQVPYLNPSLEESNRWENRLRMHFSGYKVGLAWAGSPSHRNDQFRSIDPAFLSPFAEFLLAQEVVFFSLQKFEGRKATFPSFPLEKELIQECNDLGKTAAFLSCLDLVITVDTSIAHLAGSMGKEVWILLPFVPDWRWMLHRQESPWYPTARLFRQKQAGDWEGVIQEVQEALKRKIYERGST